MTAKVDGLFSLENRVAVVIGASGAIGRALAHGVGSAGARVALVARRPEPLAELAETLGAEGIDASFWSADALDQARLTEVRDEIVARWGSIDILLNVAGGNIPAATLADDASPFAIDLAAYRDVVALNLLGTVAPVNAFGPALADNPTVDSSIVNISSMAAAHAMTRVGGYGAAKAAVESLTRWMAVELARRATGIRVNAIAPGFLVGEQNRSLILNPDGTPTSRGRTIIANTPLGRFGEAAELVSTVVWLCSPGARFVTGTVVPVDGGFSAFSGV